MQYIALFDLGDGADVGVGAMFPDVPGCVTVGDDFADAFRNAHEALTGHLEAMMEDGDPIPAPRTLEQIKSEWEDWAEWEKEGNFVVGIVSAFPSTKTKKVTLSIDASVLERVDEVAKNRSAFFTTAARTMLNQSNPA